MRILVHGLLPAASIGRLTTDGDRFIAELETNTDRGRFAVRVEGRWDDAAGRGFIEERVIVDTPRAEGIGERHVFQDWVHVPAIDAWVASRADWHEAAGKLAESLVFRGAEPFEPADFERLIALPDPLGADPVRGDLTIRAVADYRPGAEELRRFEEGRLIAREPIRSSSTSRAGGYRVYGWIAASLIAVALTGVWLRRRVAPG